MLLEIKANFLSDSKHQIEKYCRQQDGFGQREKLKQVFLVTGKIFIT